MINEQFQKIVDAQLADIKATLIAKADEYARGDRLSNFKRIAALRDITPEDALLGLISKHIVAIYDFVDDIGVGTVQPIERWDEKIGDVIAYMILLKALVTERMEKPCPTQTT